MPPAHQKTARPSLPAAQNAETVSGIAIMCVAMLLIPVMDGIAKGLGGVVSGLQIGWARMFFQMLLLFPLILVMRGRRGLFPNRLGLCALRGILIALASTFFFIALGYMPLVDAIAIFFVEPMVLVVLSALILRERVGWRRQLAVAVGFGGALLVIQPSFAEVGWPSVLPLLVAVIFAFYLILTRILAHEENPLTLQFSSGVSGFLFLSVLMLIAAGFPGSRFAPIMPDAGVWALFFCIGVIATVSHLMVVAAFKRAPASVLAPFQYVEIVSGTLIGYFVFGDFPNALKWLGIAIIIGSGLFIIWREARVERA